MTYGPLALTAATVLTATYLLAAGGDGAPADKEYEGRHWPPEMGLALALDNGRLELSEFFEYEGKEGPVDPDDFRPSLGDVTTTHQLKRDWIVARRVDGKLLSPDDVIKACTKQTPIILSSKMPPDRRFLPLFKPDAIVLQWPISARVLNPPTSVVPDVTPAK